ncbi:PEP-CTERM sorting domain-containing protein [Roseisolibacter sp. H3M3-2]|uniref:PEP-CTERM sorting domain-containing protein n=1 Tax=Roseisolibacter sp. H3M3-2 TaxID=3031323 RepID=UPI0023DCBCF0|nr:PEP-CTERM sorting domain-containing protein [Roseisolibacter sp. H3M3-2]MDF1501440.1 PEP-CTERM sorting domain-containing protein [Roseisolibacter sp. H3M3-2]
MPSRRSWSALALLLVALAPAQARAQCPAGSFCYFGTDVGGTDATRAPNVNSAATRANFLSALTGVGTESFDGLADGATNPSLSFAGAGTATLGGAGAVETFAGAGANGAGRYPTSGTRFYEATSSNAGTTFTISFSDPVAAFGFYGIDVGDQGSQLALRFTLVGGTTLDWVLPYTPSVGRNSARDGSLLYAGFINTTSFTSVQFRGTDADDVFAFDDMTIGSAQQVTNPPGSTVPEPSTYVLLASGLGILGLVGRRRALSARS